MSAPIRSPYSPAVRQQQQQQRGRGQPGARASSDNFRGINFESAKQQLHQPLTTAAWRHVLAAHCCRADMRGSVNRAMRVSYMDVGCRVCSAGITMVMRIFLI